MLTEFVLFFFLLLIIAALLNGEFAFTLLYLVFGAVLFGWAWSRQAGRAVRYSRKFEERAFWGEEIPIRIEIQNTGWLPVPWLYLHESLPVELAPGGPVKHVLSLGPNGRAEIAYQLQGRKRGRYPIGPLFATCGDPIGLARPQDYSAAPDHITVFPKIIPLTSLHLPSRSPQGTLRHRQPIFEDPARLLNKRDYTAGDSLRRIDWKSSAALGRLQVKQFEPSIALEASIFLNLNASEYESQHRIDATELAIVVAASIANWVAEQRQAVGLVTNGIDPYAENRSVSSLPPRKGRGHLMRLLETLARLQSAPTIGLTDLLRRESPPLPWGTTVVVITGRADESLFDELIQVQRRGQNVVLILTGRAINIQKAAEQARNFGFPLYAFQNEAGLDIWRRS
ncbi:MAG: DUF58 domain-containing protein [Anaerolineales bacterium]